MIRTANRPILTTIVLVYMPTGTYCDEKVEKIYDELKEIINY